MESVSECVCVCVVCAVCGVCTVCALYVYVCVVCTVCVVCVCVCACMCVVCAVCVVCALYVNVCGVWVCISYLYHCDRTLGINSLTEEGLMWHMVSGDSAHGYLTSYLWEKPSGS